jgi:HEPN domain-containing protein
MQLDQVRAQDTRAWLDLAARDLRRVEILLTATPPDIEGSLFHSQQAAEKALKGFLTWHDVRFRRVHDLDEIGRQCVDLDSTLTEMVGSTRMLSGYASRFRYPGAAYQPTPKDADAAAAVAREVFQTVLNRLPAEARP